MIQRHPFLRWAATLFVLTMIWPTGALCADDDVPREFLTLAETSGFKQTPDYAETIEFVRRLMAPIAEPPRPGWNNRYTLRLDGFGRSAQGRAMPLVIASTRDASTPDRARRSGKPILLVFNGIHAGEIDGKDASLMLLRDIALGKHDALLDKVTLLLVPIYNVDGHERRSRYNRPNQNGPEEMGFRTTTKGNDLNRDHTKLRTPEARALIQLYNRWKPHMVIDNHVTNGSDHEWVLTYIRTEAPQLATGVSAWLDGHLERVLAGTEERGHRTGPYISVIDRNDPSKGFRTAAGEARFSSGYFALRHRPAITVENHVYKTYEQRVRANHAYMLETLEDLAARGDELVAAVAAAEAETVSHGSAGAAPSTINLSFKETAEQDRILWPVYDWKIEDSPSLGVPVLRYQRGKLRETEVPWHHRVEPDAVVTRPRGYLIPPGWPVIEETLLAHGLRVERLTREMTLPVETRRMKDPEFAGFPYQGLHRVNNVTVETRSETRTLPPRTLWVPADQPDFEVAAQLLEPEAPDSLLRWGLLSAVFERKEWIGPGKLDPMLPELLKDPKIRQEWEAALEDEAFAANPRARLLWWHQRTPYWDETIGLMPAYRLMESRTLPTEPVGGSPKGKGTQ